MKSQNKKPYNKQYKKSLLKGIGVFATALLLLSSFSIGAFALKEPLQEDISSPVSQVNSQPQSEEAPPSSNSVSQSQAPASYVVDENSLPTQGSSNNEEISSSVPTSTPSSQQAGVSSVAQPESGMLADENQAELFLLEEGSPIVDFAGLQEAISAFNEGTQDVTITIGQDIILDSTLTIGPSPYTLTFVSALAEAPSSLFVQSDFRHFKLLNSTVNFGNVAITRSPAYRGTNQFGGGLTVHGTSTMAGGIISNNAIYNSAKNEGLGGGIYVAPYSNFTLTDGTISQNTAFRGAGGGVFVDAGATFTMAGGIITSNTSNNGAGAFALGSKITMQGNAQIINNTAASGDGGGVFLMHNYPQPQTGKLIMEGNATIGGNAAIDDIPQGGGIFSNSGAVIIKDNASVVNNTAKDHPSYGKGAAGGGIYIRGDKNGQLTTSGNVLISGNIVESNAATVYGGGIGAGYENQITLNGATVSQNTANGPNSYGGGISGYFISLNQANILNNTASGTGTNGGRGGRGGGIWSENTLTIQASTISGNTASANGGGVLGYKIQLDASKITNNSTAGNGGGLYALTSLSMGSNEITGNTAGSNGGGIFVSSYPQLTLNGQSTVTFSGNSASSLFKATELPKGLGPWAGQVTSISPNLTGNNSVFVFNNYDINYTEGTPVSLFRLVYHNDGATSGTVPVDTNGSAAPGSNLYLPGSSAAIQGNTGNLAKDGYSFSGWADTPGQSTPQYQRTAVVENIQSDILLYPVWQPTSYTITYTLAGGTSSSLLPASYTADLLPLAVENPTKTGYTFAGWTSKTLPSLTVPTKDLSLAQGTLGDIDLVANWVPNGGYTIYYNTNGGTPESLPAKTDVNWDSENLLPTLEFQKEGHEFLGWLLTDGGPEVLVENTTSYSALAASESTSSLTFTAQWKQTFYTVVFVDWDETQLTSQQVAHGGSATPPASPKREGYQFSGWSIDASHITANVTITAQYTKLAPAAPSSSSPASSSAPVASSSSASSSNSLPTSSAPVASSSSASSSSSLPTSSAASSSSTLSSPPSSSTSSNASSSAPSSASSTASSSTSEAYPSEASSSHALAAGNGSSTGSGSHSASTAGGSSLTSTPEISPELEAQQGHGIFENIINGNIPLFDFTPQNTWSLFSLLFAFASLVLFAVSGVLWFLRRKGSSNNTLKNSQPKVYKAFTILLSTAAFASVLAFLLFFILQDLTLPSVYINKSTPLFLGLLLISLGALIAVKIFKRKKSILPLA